MDHGLQLMSVLDSSRLIGQFVLAAVDNRAPAGWLSDRIGGWFLARHPRLPAIRLTGAGNRALGWMLGYPISEEGRLLSDGEALCMPAGAVESTAALEAFIYGFGGRFAVALVEAQHPRLYLDPCGSLSAVYCAHQRLVASTPNLIPYDDHSRDRVELARAIAIPHTNGQYPLGLTPRYRVERILPNHFLDLSDWRMVRHWPTQPLGEMESVEGAIAEITAIVKRQIAAVVSAKPTYLCLTAGQDSRMLLACARGLADQLELITAEIGDLGAAIDCDTARRIAKRFGLKHRILPKESATEEDLQEWMFRISFSTGEIRGWQSATMFKRLPRGRAVLGEAVGELARGYWWRVDDSETTVVSPERLVEICKCPPDEVPLARARSWLATVPAANALQVLDLYYVEQDLGCWAGVWLYSECEPGFQLFALSHRRVIELMLTLPIAYRRSGRLQRDVIAREWAELLEWPFNHPVGLSRLVFRAKRAINKGAIALRYPGLALDWLHRGTIGWLQ